MPGELTIATGWHLRPERTASERGESVVVRRRLPSSDSGTSSVQLILGSCTVFENWSRLVS
jgi:hypothetical protein